MKHGEDRHRAIEQNRLEGRNEPARGGGNVNAAIATNDILAKHIETVNAQYNLRPAMHVGAAKTERTPLECVAKKGRVSWGTERNTIAAASVL